MGGFDQHGTDRKGLEEHLDLAGRHGAEVDPAGLRNLAQDRDIGLSHDQNPQDGPKHERQRHGTPVEQVRHPHDREAGERPADQDLVDQGIDHAAELRGRVVSAGDVTVDDIREPRDDEQHEGDIQKERAFGGLNLRGIKDHPQEDDR